MAERKQAARPRRSASRRRATCRPRSSPSPSTSRSCTRPRVAEMNARRQGTHSSLTRGEVSMTGAKAWKQKGTGRARAGALSVPHRDRRRRRLRPQAPPLHLQGQPQGAPQGAALGAQRARRARHARGAPGRQLQRARHQAGGRGPRQVGRRRPRPLVVVTGEEAAAAKSYRNIPKVVVASAEGVGVAELVGARSLVISEPALEVLERRSAARSSRGRRPARPEAPRTWREDS